MSSEETPTLREYFEARFDSLEAGQSRIEKETTEKLAKIEVKIDAATAQVKITNGRTSALETFRAQAKAVIAVSVLLMPYALTQLLK